MWPVAARRISKEPEWREYMSLRVNVGNQPRRSQHRITHKQRHSGVHSLAEAITVSRERTHAERWPTMKADKNWSLGGHPSSAQGRASPIPDSRLHVALPSARLTCRMQKSGCPGRLPLDALITLVSSSHCDSLFTKQSPDCHLASPLKSATGRKSASQRVPMALSMFSHTKSSNWHLAPQSPETC